MGWIDVPPYVVQNLSYWQKRHIQRSERSPGNLRYTRIEFAHYERRKNVFNLVQKLDEERRDQRDPQNCGRVEYIINCLMRPFLRIAKAHGGLEKDGLAVCLDLLEGTLLPRVGMWSRVGDLQGFADGRIFLPIVSRGCLREWSSNFQEAFAQRTKLITRRARQHIFWHYSSKKRRFYYTWMQHLKIGVQMKWSLLQFSNLFGDILLEDLFQHFQFSTTENQF